MPPRKTVATERQHTPENKGVQKNHMLVTPQRNTRSRAVRSTNASAINPMLPDPLQEPTATPQYQAEPPQPRRQKRGYVSEDEPTDNSQRSDLQSVSGCSLPLTKSNLKEHDRLTGSATSSVMDSSEHRGKKRPASRPSSSAYISQETTSVRSQISFTAANYRFGVLQRARISILPGRPPEEIQSRISAVLQRTVSEEREQQLSRFAKTLCEDFTNIFNGKSREEDFVSPIQRALSSMNSGNKFDFPRNTDWDPSLKPTIRQSSLGLNSPFASKDHADESVSRPRKRQSDTSYLSPDTSQVAMRPPPPPILPKPVVLSVETPRPDITGGFHHSTIVEALVGRGFDELYASDFLNDLQEQQILCSSPPQGGPPVRFPIMVIEVKAYATGNPVFEAQNQVAVSGSCMTILQHNLTDLSNSVSRRSYNIKAPVAFSICTEGPYMELWVHYTTLKSSIRMYNMNILKTCHTSLPEGVMVFLMAVDRIMSWAREDFLNEIVEQLVLVENAVGTQHTT